MLVMQQKSAKGSIDENLLKESLGRLDISKRGRGGAVANYESNRVKTLVQEKNVAGK